MTQARDSSEALSGVVMGRTAGSALAGQEAAESVPSTAMKIDGGALVARVLQSQGVKYLFAVNGGHTWPILAALRDYGIKLIHMRHEQSCAYAADGWARTTGTPGICSVTAGCGLTNAVTGLCAAGLAGSAVVCIAGQHPTTEDGLGSFQEAYGSEVCRSFSKFTKRVLDWSTIEIDLRQAFREATSPPQGVALVEIPTNILYGDGVESDQRRGAKVYAPDELRSGDHYILARCLRKYGDFLRNRGHLQLARDALLEALRLSGHGRGTRQRIYILGCLGDLERQKQNYAAASEHLERAVELARATFIPGWLGNLHLGLAELALDRNRLDDAKILLEQAEAHYKNTHPMHWWGEIQVGLARCRLIRAAGSQEWSELARTVHREAIAAGYSRDAAFANELLNGQPRARNVLMFL